MKEISLTRGGKVIVDDQDYEILSLFKWYRGASGYAQRASPRDENGKQRTLFMHRQILGEPTGLFADHINGDQLDNRRNNLRAVSVAQSNCNRGGQKNRPIAMKGVVWNKKSQMYQAQIRSNKKLHYLGLFSDLISAALAYNVAAKQLHGEYARLNCIT